MFCPLQIRGEQTRGNAEASCGQRLEMCADLWGPGKNRKGLLNQEKEGEKRKRRAADLASYRKRMNDWENDTF